MMFAIAFLNINSTAVCSTAAGHWLNAAYTFAMATTPLFSVMFDHMSGHLCSLGIYGLSGTVSDLRQVLAKTLNEPACEERVKDIGRGHFSPGSIRLVQKNLADPTDPKTLFGHYSLAHYWPDIEEQVAKHGHWVLTVALRSGRNAKRMQFLLDQEPVTLVQDNEDYHRGHLRYFVTWRLPRLHIWAKNWLDHWDDEMASRLVIGSPGNYHLLPDKFKVVPEIAIIVLAQDALALARMPASLRSNLDVVMFAITQNRNAFWMASGDLRGHPRVRELFRQMPPQILGQDLTTYSIMSPCQATVGPCQAIGNARPSGMPGHCVP